MIRSSIDIGSNTCLLLIADVNGSDISVLREEQRVPRLGRGVDASKKLDEDSIERVLSALREYREIVQKTAHHTGKTIVTATSAVRDAANREEFLKRVKEETGFEITILSGDDEAEYTFAGAVSTLYVSELSKNEKTAVIDIGGGSTELIVGSTQSSEPDFAKSLDIGCVRFTERFFEKAPVSESQLEASYQAALIEIEKLNWLKDSDISRIVGVAGTVTSIAFIKQKLTKYEPEKLNGVEITVQEIEELVEIFRTKTEDQIVKLHPEVMEGRADIFPAGLTILKAFLNVTNRQSLITSTGGVRHGALLRN